MSTPYYVPQIEGHEHTDLLPMPLPTLPGCAPGIVAMDDQIPRRWITVQCSGCFETRTDWPILAAGWALFPGSLRHGDERLCRKCRDACGCEPCKRTGR